MDVSIYVSDEPLDNIDDSDYDFTERANWCEDFYGKSAIDSTFIANCNVVGKYVNIVSP